MPISERQKVVLDLLLIEKLTPKQIQQRLQISKARVYQIITCLRKKGLIGLNYTPPRQEGGVVTPFFPNLAQNEAAFPLERHIISYHGSQFRLTPLNSSDRYKSILKKSNRLEVDGNMILLYRHCLVLCAREGLDFRGPSEMECIGKATRYWNQIIRKIEFRLNILLIKEFNTKIREYKAHFARVGDESAEDILNQGEKLYIFDKEDGKLRDLVDASNGEIHMEFVHPNKAMMDIEHWRTFINELHEFYDQGGTLTELVQAVDTSMRVLKDITHLKPQDEPRTYKQTSLRDFEPTRPDYFG